MLICPHGTRIFRNIRKGFPDIFAIKPPHMLWLELKRERGQLDPEQKRIGAKLRACRQIWLPARPRDRELVMELIAHPEKADELLGTL